MRAKLLATTVRTPRWRAAKAACSRLELDLPPVLRREDDLAVVDLGIRGRGSELRRLAELARVGDRSAQRRRRSRRRRAEVDAIFGRPAPSGEVAVERAHGDGTGRRRLAHADAG